MKAPVGTFDKEKAFVGAFSGHCENSRRSVDSSNIQRRHSRLIISHRPQSRYLRHNLSLGNPQWKQITMLPPPPATALNIHEYTQS